MVTRLCTVAMCNTISHLTGWYVEEGSYFPKALLADYPMLACAIFAFLFAAPPDQTPSEQKAQLSSCVC